MIPVNLGNGAKEDCLVVGKRDVVELYTLHEDLKSLVLRKTIPLFELILDIKPFLPIGCTDYWLAVSVDTDILILSLEDNNRFDIIIERLPLNKEFEGARNPETRSLCVESSKFLSTLTSDGSVVIYPVNRPKNLDNFEKAQDLQRSFNWTQGKVKLFKDPVSFTLSMSHGRTCLPVDCIDAVHEDNTHVTFSVLYHDELYEYHHSYFTWDTEYCLEQFDELDFEANDGIRFREKVSPIALPFCINMGTLFVGKSGLYLRNYKRVVPHITISVGNKDKDLSVIGLSHNPVVKKKYKKLEISTAVVINPNDVKCTRIILISKKGDVYLTELKFHIANDDSGYPDTIEVQSWTTHKLQGKLYNAQRVVKLKDNIFAVQSRQRGLGLFSIDMEQLRLTELFNEKALSAVLDISMTNTTVPKIQAVGGGPVTEGIISTWYKGFGSKMLNERKTALEPGILNCWNIDDYFLVKQLDSTVILKQTNRTFEETHDLDAVLDVDGEILDVQRNSSGNLMCITTKGIYQDGVRIQAVDVVHGVFSQYGNAVYCTSKSIYFRSHHYRANIDEVSCLSYLEQGTTSLVCVGDWKGDVKVIIPDKPTQKLSFGTAISSILGKVIGGETMMLIGTSHGDLHTIRKGERNKWNIGSSPVSLTDCDDFVLVYNAECVLKFVFDDTWNCSARGYIQITPPELIKYTNGQIWTLSDGAIGVLHIDKELMTLKHELQLPRLVRKCIKFKNFMNLSLFVTLTQLPSKLYEDELDFQCQLEVIENNTFKTVSTYKLPRGVEVTDAVNLAYRNDVISTMNEPPINFGVESFLSQCFAISCLHHTEDMKGSPIEIFSVDQDGKLERIATAPSSGIQYYCLTSHANRLLIAGGTRVCAYQIDYSLEHSKFTLQRVTEFLRPEHYTSHVTSVGPDVIITDALASTKYYKLEVLDEPDNEVFLRWVNVEYAYGFNNMFTVALDVFYDLELGADSYGGIGTGSAGADRLGVYSNAGYVLPDEINVIKAIERSKALISQKDLHRLMEDKGLKHIESIPLFLLGSASGGMYSLTFIQSQEVIEATRAILESKVQEIVYAGWKCETLFDYETGEVTTDGYIIDGDLVEMLEKSLGGSLLSNLFERHCSLL